MVGFVVGEVVGEGLGDGVGDGVGVLEAWLSTCSTTVNAV